ncbi:MAG TPA: hypothetical protein VHC96_04855 [Puia sp.]|jgi:hypothetical protein|nr:hypothetical protein [Puia sp.]
MSHKVENDKLEQIQITVVPDNQMPDYHNDPTVIAAVERARAFLEKAGLPKGWDKNNNFKSSPQPE